MNKPDENVEAHCPARSNHDSEVNSFLLSAAAAVCGVASSYAQNVVVPSGSSNVDGNTYSLGGPAIQQPFTIRYQQVYAASEFGLLAERRGGWITDVYFRGDATNGTQSGGDMPRVQVNLSTTERGPDGLSATFSDNVGTDDTVMFSGSLQTGLVGGHRQGPEPFTFEIQASVKLFFYNPAAGNLLLDVRVFEGSTSTNVAFQPVFDAVSATNDAVSRVLWRDVNASTGQVDTIGLPTLIFFWANPKLSVQVQTNSVVLSWPIPAFLPLPVETVLETRQALAPQAKWQSVTNGIVTSNFVNTFTITSDSTGAAAFFRLISTAPP